ncbi:hypothetical protein T09_12474 [Trichinella sp. T9]|nr:hypothetical protein T09_12474 [Trichinella sp. T9]
MIRQRCGDPYLHNAALETAALQYEQNTNALLNSTKNESTM